ncbi:MAG: GNAT family N-acetyltransferase [Mycobacteriales bacterium]
MTMLSTTGEASARAAAVAEGAVRRAGISVLELSTADDVNRAAGLLREVWRGPQDPVPANLLRAVHHAGGYVYGAVDDVGTLLAVSMGLLATDGLHSHITGVVPSGQRRGLGFALKQHQRAWALERGMTTISWTCDPLVRRNVAFNLHALGARVARYLPDYYGPMDDGVNKGDESDRFELCWDLLGHAAVQAAEGRIPFLDGADRPLAVALGPGGLPVMRPVSSTPRVVVLPPDIETLRGADGAASLEWRYAVRSALLPVLSSGGVILGLTSGGAIVVDDPA